MTPEQAYIWNAAIDAAIQARHNGVGAMLALKKRIAVMVDHVSPYHTKQEVAVGEEDGGIDDAS